MHFGLNDECFLFLYTVFQEAGTVWLLLLRSNSGDGWWSIVPPAEEEDLASSCTTERLHRQLLSKHKAKAIPQRFPTASDNAMNSQADTEAIMAPAPSCDIQETRLDSQMVPSDPPIYGSMNPLPP